MKYQTMRIDRLKHLNIEALIGNVELTVSGETLTIVPVAPEKKPRTKAEYVKCDLSLGDFIEGFRRGLLFYYQGGEYCQIKKENQAMFHAGNDSCFVKKETPMTEREMFIEGVEKIGAELTENGDWSFACLAAEIFDSKLVN